MRHVRDSAFGVVERSPELRHHGQVVVIEFVRGPGHRWWPTTAGSHRSFLRAWVPVPAGSQPGVATTVLSKFCVDDTEPAFLARAPLGVAARFTAIRGNVSFEVVPALRVIPEPFPTLLGSFAFRHYFGP